MPPRRATRSSRSPTACCRGTRRTATRACSSRAATRAGTPRAARASRASTTVRHAARSVPFPPSPRLFFTPRPLPVHRRGPPRHLESRFHRGVDGQQLDLLPRPAPRLLAVERDVPGAGSGAGPLCTQLPRIHHPCHSVALAQRLTFHLFLFSQGPDALPGDARWRRGESVSRESARNAMTGIEAAAHSQLVFQKRM